MTVREWRLLVTESTDGATNMAIDEVLWRGRQAGTSPPTVRFFGWDPPTVSLGYGQPLDDSVDVAACRRLGVGLVRRPTGGSAIYHDGPERELTYSVLADGTDLGGAGDLLETYRWIAVALLRGLRGLGAAADDEVARRRIYAIKGRPVGLPLILMAAAESQLEGWVHVDGRAEAFVRRWWPGPLTVILHAKGGGTLGVRIPKHEVALELLRASGPLMTTSANLHGKDPAMNANEADALTGIAAVLDGGAAPGGLASSVLDLTGPEPHVLREGAIPTAQLLGPPPPRAG